MDYNCRKPKYERGMLTGGSAKIEVLGREYQGVALRRLGRSYSPYSNILVVWETCILTFRESLITTLQPK